MLGKVLQCFAEKKKFLCGPYVNEIDVDRFEGGTPRQPPAASRQALGASSQHTA